MPMMTNLTDAVAPTRRQPGALTRYVALVCAALLGLVLVYGAGFAKTDELHNGAHDARHAAGFPCH